MIGEYWNELTNTFEAIRTARVPAVSLFGLFFLVVLVNVAYVLNEFIESRRRKRDMRERAATLAEKKVLANGISDTIEELVHTEKLSRKKGNYWLKRFAHDYGLDDLKPRKIKLSLQKMRAMKKEIRGRLRMNGVKLPESKKRPAPKNELEAELFKAIQ